MKLRAKAVKLGNVDVHYISLVERGANRAPFKIQKREKPMSINFNLRKIIKGRQDAREEAAKNVPSVVGYVILKEDNTPEIVEALKKAGVKIDVLEEEGDVIVMKQDDTPSKDEKNVAIKLDDDFIVVCKGFDPYAMTADMSFGEILKSQGFMPGFSMATDALYTSIRNSLVSAEDQKDAVSKIDEAMQEFHDYVVELAGSIPQSAFKALESFRKAKSDAAEAEVKLAASLSAAEKTFMDGLEGAAKFAFMRMTPEERAAKMGAKAKKEEGAEDKDAKDAAASKVKKEEGDTPPAFDPKELIGMVGEAVTTAVKGATEGLSKQLGELAVTVEATQKGFEKLKTSTEEVAKDAKEAVELSKKNEETLSSTVIGGKTGGDPDDESYVKKGEGEMGCIDTSRHNVRKVDLARQGRRLTSHML